MSITIHIPRKLSKAHNCSIKFKCKLEPLHSEIPPTATWLPILLIHIRSQVKTRQSQSYKFKKIAKNSNFKILQATLHATHTSCLIRCINMKWIQPKLKALQSRHGMREGWTEWNQYTPPNKFVVWGGIINFQWKYSRVSFFHITMKFCI